MNRSASIFTVLGPIALLAMLLPSLSHANPLCGPFLRVVPLGYGLNHDGRVLVYNPGPEDDTSFSSTAALWLGAVLQKVEFVGLVSKTPINSFSVIMGYVGDKFPSSREVIEIPPNTRTFTAVLKKPIVFQDDEFELTISNVRGRSTSKRINLHLDLSNWFCPTPIK